jgi:hypothetical protein
MYGPVFNSSSSSTFGVGQGSDNSSPFSKPYATDGSHDTWNSSAHGEKKKSHGLLGSITDFGKGIIKGGMDAVTSLFSVKGMIMALGTVALVALAPAIAIPLLISAGVVMGGTQIIKGL